MKVRGGGAGCLKGGIKAREGWGGAKGGYDQTQRDGRKSGSSSTMMMMMSMMMISCIGTSAVP